MTGKSFLFSSESVTEGHPDKVADRISDAVLDEVLRKSILSEAVAWSSIINEMMSALSLLKTNQIPNCFGQN